MKYGEPILLKIILDLKRYGNSLIYLKILQGDKKSE